MTPNEFTPAELTAQMVYKFMMDETGFGETIAQSAADGVRIGFGEPRTKPYVTMYDPANGELLYVLESSEQADRIRSGGSTMAVENRIMPVVGVTPVQLLTLTPETSEDVTTRRVRRLLDGNERLRPAVAAMQKAGHNAAEIIETLFPGN